MDIKNLIEFLPPIFKSNDTYKVNGKGFLERFLEICGEYFSDTITPDIDNILDIIQIDTTPKEYLNYLWEFLGEMPFANIYNVDVNKWEMYYDGTHNNEDKWLLPNNGLISLTEQNARDLIRYSLSLLKIRGTHKFFTIISRLYGLEIKLNPITSPVYKAVNPHIDTDYLDGSSTDIKYECPGCFDFQLTIDDSYHELVFADIDGKIIMGKDNQILTGRSNYILPTIEGTNGDLEFFELVQLVSAYNEYQGKIDFKHLDELPTDVRIFVILRRTLENFFNRFVPYDVKLKISYGESGIVPDDRVTFNVLYEDPDNSILSSTNTEVNLIVEIESKWPEVDNRYMVSGNESDWDASEYHTDPIYKITSPGTFYFKMVSGSKIIPVSVGIDNISKRYTLSIKDGNILYLSEGNISITPVAKYGDILVGATIESPDGSKTNLNPGQRFTDISEGSYKVYISNQPSIYQTVYVYSKPLEDTKTIVDIPYGVQITLMNQTRFGQIKTVIGAPDTMELQNQFVVSDKDNKYSVVSIEPWIRNPNYPYNIIWGKDFITQPSKAISILLRSGVDNTKYKSVEGTIVRDGKLVVIEPGNMSVDLAKDTINYILSISTPSSMLITIGQENLSDYYEPNNIGHETDSNGNIIRQINIYYHNPLFINNLGVSSSKSGNILGTILEPNADKLTLSPSFTSEDTQRVFIQGIIKFDNTVEAHQNVWYDDDSPDPRFVYPEYLYTNELSNGNNVTVDLSGIKFKVNGNTLRRQIMVMGVDDFGLFNTAPIYIIDEVSDTQSEGLSLVYDIDDTNWSVETHVDNPLQVNLPSGNTVQVSKVYTYKLNNQVFGKDSAKFKFKLIMGGIDYSNSEGIILDLDGNAYNTKYSYIKDMVRYYITRQNGNPLVVGGGGYIFMAKISDSKPSYNIMLNLVIDPLAPDRFTVNFDMNPSKFYLPTNGKIALSNMIATRPYKYSMEEPEGISIVGPLELEDETGVVENPPIFRFSTDRVGDHTFIATGIVDPISIINDNLEYPEEIEKVFTVYKNS